MSASIKIEVKKEALDVFDLAENQIQKAIFKANLQLFNDATGSGDVGPHPVDTNFSRASWWGQSDGVPASNPTPPVKGSMNPSPAAQPDTILASVGRVFSVVNSANYIRKLEYEGTSPQNSGWINRAAARYQGNLAAYFAELQGKK